MQSIPQLAEKLGVKTKNLRKRLITENYMGKVDGKWTLTDKGIEAGGDYKNFYGRYIVWPDDFKIQTDNKDYPLLVSGTKEFEHQATNLKSAYYIFDYLPARKYSQDNISKFLLKFKDNDEEAVKRWCTKASQECEAIFRDKKIDSIIRVLGHKEKKKGKTLTPLDKLGIEISSAIECKYEPKTLTKTKINKSLKFLSKERRQNQLHGLYTYKPSGTKPKSILLIDDITTTGTTITEVCRAIQESSPNTNIYFLALARTKRKDA